MYSHIESLIKHGISEHETRVGSPSLCRHWVMWDRDLHWFTMYMLGHVLHYALYLYDYVVN